MLKLQIQHADKTIAAEVEGEEVQLFYTSEYVEGDRITCVSEEENSFLVISLEDTMGDNFVYLRGSSFMFEIPFGEKRVSYSPKSFCGDRHLITVRRAFKEEISTYRNLALNKYDKHADIDSNGSNMLYPHAFANVETRGEAVFASRNAIDGNCLNSSHGEWPFESWGINRNPDAFIRIEFGRQVCIDKLRLYTRADFPHDSWWRQITVSFSDGSEQNFDLAKSTKPHILTFEPKKTEWVMLSRLIKAEDDSPFPALTQIEVYGRGYIG